MRRLIRQSELYKFRRCRRSWMLKYHRNLHPLHLEGDPGGRNLGTLVHACLHNWSVGGDYRQALVPLPGEIINGIDILQEQRELARIMVSGYIEWNTRDGRELGIELVTSEKRLEYELPYEVYGDTVVITGKLDRLERDASYGGAYVVRDFKTVGVVAPPPPNDGQLTTYAWLVTQLYGEMPQVIRHDQLRKVKRGPRSKPPYYDRFDVPFNEDSLAAVEAQIEGVVHDLVAVAQQLEDGASHQVQAYPHRNRDCSWDCEFEDVCSLMDDGSDWEGVLSRDFKQYDPQEKL